MVIWFTLIPYQISVSSQIFLSILIIHPVLLLLQNSSESTYVGVSFQQSYRAPAWNFIKMKTPAWMFFCEFSKIFKNMFFTEHLQVADWDIWNLSFKLLIPNKIFILIIIGSMLTFMSRNLQSWTKYLEQNNPVKLSKNPVKLDKRRKVWYCFWVFF